MLEVFPLCYFTDFETRLIFIIICITIKLCKMKIAYIYDAVWPYVKGGTELRINELAKRLAQRGHKIDIYGLCWWHGGQQLRVRENVTLHGIGRPQRLYGENGRRRIAEGVYFGLKTLMRVPCRNYDVVDCQEFPYFSCFGAKLRANHNLVITFCEIWGREYWRKYLGGCAGRIGALIEKMTTKLTDNNVAVSSHVQRSLEKMNIPSTVIMNGVDYDYIQAVPAKERETDIIFVGRLIAEKNVDLLLDAVAILRAEWQPAIRCTIVGDGPERARLGAAVREKKLDNNVEFLGFVDSYDDLIGLMKSASVLALPSQREGFGVVALEANACGIPFVTIAHPMNAAADLCTVGTNGFVSNPSPKEFADSLAFALTRSSQMSPSCLKFAQGYDWERITDTVEAYYNGVC
jgi:glycosyltransferase involved in cell wall biosynthesis